jgi:hypothetical protein
MTKKIKWQKVTFPDKRVIKVGNWDLINCKNTLSEIDSVWTEILKASRYENELFFQYYSTVKTIVGEAEEPTDD